MAMLSKIIPNWSTYERGIEALVNSFFPQSGVLEGNKKGLTHEDLLIKVNEMVCLQDAELICILHQPIQRVCKYPLLFAELYKHTPFADGQQSSEEIEKILFRLRETAKEINKATNDQQTQVRIQRLWHLQDLLVLPDNVSFESSASACLLLNLRACSLHRLLHFDLWVISHFVEFFTPHIIRKMGTCTESTCSARCSKVICCLHSLKRPRILV